MNLAVFYHIKPGPPINPAFACGMFAEQMRAMKDSGLLSNCQRVFIGVNGDNADVAAIELRSPPDCKIVPHGTAARSELPTMHYMQEWLADHPDWYVCYWHAKGVSHYPPDDLHRNWRKCMERVVIVNWRACVKDLESGFESVGAHWLTPQQYPGIVKAPFWGGNFWWAKASFLLTLPKLRKNSEAREQDFDAESWIGWGPRAPRARDYAPHWPHVELCRQGKCFLFPP